MMRTKTKNDPSRYVTRALLASARIEKARVGEEIEQERRNSVAAIDERWYIKLGARRRQR
jgi:hypothetical protein